MSAIQQPVYVFALLALCTALCVLRRTPAHVLLLSPSVLAAPITLAALDRFLPLGRLLVAALLVHSFSSAKESGLLKSIGLRPISTRSLRRRAWRSLGLAHYQVNAGTSVVVCFRQPCKAALSLLTWFRFGPIDAAPLACDHATGCSWHSIVCRSSCVCALSSVRWCTLNVRLISCDPFPTAG